MKQSIAEKILEENKKVYDFLAKNFSQTRNQNWPEIEELIKYVRKGDKILDLGCGNGRLYKILKNKKIEYTGVDISKKLIEIAKKELSDQESTQPKFFVGDALNLLLKNHEFDIIFAIALLHHIPTQRLQLKVLRNCFKILKKNGLIILTVWNLRQPRLLLKYKIWPFSKDVYIPWKLKTTKPRSELGSTIGDKILKRYYHVFTKGELKQIVKKAGFKIIECYFSRKGKITNRLNGFNLILIAKK